MLLESIPATNLFNFVHQQKFKFCNSVMIARFILTIFHVKVQTFIVPAETCWYGNCKTYEEAAWGYNGNSKTHFNHISQYGANLCRSFLYHVQWPKITWCQSLYISQQPGVQTRQCQWEQVCRRAGLRDVWSIIMDKDARNLWFCGYCDHAGRTETPLGTQMHC